VQGREVNQVKKFEDIIVLAVIVSLMIPAALVTFFILGSYVAESAF
jgi:Na+-transporting methylmalonyl-CoA/oxaloacetate decarboxylase beta subunit